MSHEKGDDTIVEDTGDRFLLPQASYYLMFNQLQQANASIKTPPPHVDTLSSNEEAGIQNTITDNDMVDKDNEKNNSGERNDFWQEFEWSEEDIDKAKMTLNNSKDKCDITQNVRGNYLIKKLEENASKNWNTFYTNHQTKFFKDRHYLEKAFPEFEVVYGNHQNKIKLELDRSTIDKEKCIHDDNDTMSSLSYSGDFTIVEIGSGTGATMLPLLELHPTITLLSKESTQVVPTCKRMVVWGLDFSSVAIDLLKKDERFLKAQNDNRSHAAVWDITRTHPRDICQDGVQLQSTSDISLLLFCLSAISPPKMTDAAINVAATLKPGGTLILRDYGRFDAAQIKLGTQRGKCIEDNFYVKHDGTRCYYFELKELERLFVSVAGLEVIELKYIQRLYKNRAEDQVRRRVWVQGRFKKPLSP